MAKKKDEYLVIPVEEKEMEEKNSPTDVPNQAEDELEEKFDKVFWLKVWRYIHLCEFREKVRQYCINKFVPTTLLSKNVI